MPDRVEDSTSSSKKPRRFAPDGTSTSTHSSRNAPAEASEPAAVHFEDAKPAEGDPPKESPKPRRKFAVEPVSTTTRSNRKQPHEQVEEAAGSSPADEKMVDPEVGKQEKKPRRFKPEIIETTKRSRKSGDDTPALLPGDKTNVSPGDIVPKSQRPTLRPIPPANSPAVSLLEVPTLKPPPMRQGSMKPHNNTRTNTRQHSFKVPSLPDIDSSESDKSNAPSGSASQESNSDTSDEGRKNRTRNREGDDEDFSGYLLALAARAAEKQLREQEAAAFVNTDRHEPVAHYVNRSDSDDSHAGRPSHKAARMRGDSDDEKAELQQMQKYGEQLYSKNRNAEGTAGAEDGLRTSKNDVWTARVAAAPYSDQGRIPRKYIGGYQRCPDLKMMRKHASPPMLGGDIDFPRCASPDYARFDVTQGADYLRRNICYLTEQSSQQTGLWGQPNERKAPDKPPAVNVEANANEKGAGGGKALWGGFCNGKEEKTVPTPKGLMTPMRTPMRTPVATPAGEREDPFSKLGPEASEYNVPAPPRTPVVAPPTPPESRSPTREVQKKHLKVPSVTDIEARLEVEARIEEEFSDHFVTQVYNYLSFGYPALARKFDEELASVSKVSVAELREDDKSTEARGFLSLGDDEVGGAERSIEEPVCRRWRALRRYVREWGRQMIAKEGGDEQWGVDGFDPHEAWGMPARRGSWGI